VVLPLSLRQGWTDDGWAYRIYWNKAGFTVIFENEWKEIWALDEIKVEKADAGYHAFVEGVPIISRSLQEVVFSVAKKIAYRLEHDGSWVIRGAERMAKEEVEILRKHGFRPEEIRRTVVPPHEELPFGKTRLVWEKAIPVKPMALARAERERVKREIEHKPPAVRLPKPAPRKEVLGLGNEGRRRLRVLFESTLAGLGISVTRATRVRAEEIIYQLDARFKYMPREEAVERAVNEFLKWIRDEFYFK